jgi:hypothetical protein
MQAMVVESGYAFGGGAGDYSSFWNAILGIFNNDDNDAPQATIVDNKGNIINENGPAVFVYRYKEDSYNYIGNIGGTISANEIFGNLLRNDVNIAEGLLFNPITFYNLVKGKGDWDLKNNKNTIYGLSHTLDKLNNTTTWFDFNRERMTTEDLGNFHYGTTGRAAGISEGLLLYAAGQAQIRAGTSIPAYQTPEMMRMYPGDDPWHQHMIREGFRYFNYYMN